MLKRKEIKIAYQGVRGTYSEEAILEIAGKNNINFKPVGSLDFKDLFENIERDGLGLVPIENSNAGTVAPCVDLLKKYDFEIIGEYFFTVNHTLLVNKGINISMIEKVYSHPQALSQCSEFLNKNKLEAVAFGDTAGSAKYIAKNNIKDIAAIGSKRLADIYNLKIIKRKFQNSKDNITRFLLVKNKNKKYPFIKKLNKTTEEKTSVIFETRHIPGVLYKTLGGFVSNGINLTKIESRPSGDKGFHYYFYLEFEGNLKSKEAKNAIEELEFFSKSLKILGSYKQI